MTIHELTPFITKDKLTPTIVSYADATHYLVGAEDSEGNFFEARNDKGQPTVFLSLREAEDYFAKQGVETVMIRVQSPYDEMIGGESAHDVVYSQSVVRH